VHENDASRRFTLPRVLRPEHAPEARRKEINLLSNEE